MVSVVQEHCQSAFSFETITISDLAEFLQVPKPSLYKLVQQGKVPRQKAGKHWRFHEVVIDRWLVQSKDTSAAAVSSGHTGVASV